MNESGVVVKILNVDQLLLTVEQLWQRTSIVASSETYGFVLYFLIYVTIVYQSALGALMRLLLSYSSLCT